MLDTTRAERDDQLRQLVCLKAEELHAPRLPDFEIISVVRGLTLAGS